MFETMKAKVNEAKEFAAAAKAFVSMPEGKRYLADKLCTGIAIGTVAVCVIHAVKYIAEEV